MTLTKVELYEKEHSFDIEKPDVTGIHDDSKFRHTNLIARFSITAANIVEIKGIFERAHSRSTASVKRAELLMDVITPFQKSFPPQSKPDSIFNLITFLTMNSIPLESSLEILFKQLEKYGRKLNNSDKQRKRSPPKPRVIEESNPCLYGLATEAVYPFKCLWAGSLLCSPLCINHGVFCYAAH
ncbi:hypothetical protein AVEN_70593-1 [Araneus ventricosus]|uniref:Uncharacterized protein n=1 Tax=Araneus ventricosus TaxID=182803 RepID=A0A4Y2CFN7_ARAVE|nr:hypothetical protein AVEN_70593-1 [Araneus ventricosus]